MPDLTKFSRVDDIVSGVRNSEGGSAAGMRGPNEA